MITLLLIICLFGELVLLASLGCILLLGGLPDSLDALLYAAGIILVISSSVAMALPRAWVHKISLHGALVSGSLLFALPFVWLVGTSFKYSEETFVSPPRWVPAIVHPAIHSPYVAEPMTRKETAESLTDEAWEQCFQTIPPDQLSQVPFDVARKAMAVTLAGIPVQQLDHATIMESWARVYRAVIIGQVTITDVHGQTRVVPASALAWSVCGGAHFLKHDGLELPVSYDLSNHNTFTLSCTLDRDWVVQHDGLDRLVWVAVSMRQDRSWHKLKAQLTLDGKIYQSKDSLYLGDYHWRTVGFKLGHRDQHDDRDLGVFPLVLKGKSSTESHEIRLDLLVHRQGLLGATFAKYTQTYRDAWYADSRWPLYIFNSVLLVVLNVLGQLLACSMAAYAFSRLHWPGRDAVFALLLSTMMLPAFVTMIPQFLIFKQLGWYNTLLPLWVPAFFGTPFFIFLLRQFMMGLPRELEEAARIDGCSCWGIYWWVILPLMKPALAAVAVFTFMDTWNEFMRPLIYLSDQRLYPLSLGLFNFRSAHGSDFGMLMAASSMMTLPVIALFFMCQRYFIQGVTLTGMKG